MRYACETEEKRAQAEQEASAELEAMKKEIRLQLLEAKEGVRERMEKMLEMAQQDKEQLLREKHDLEEAISKVTWQKDEEIAQLQLEVQRLRAAGDRQEDEPTGHPGSGTTSRSLGDPRMSSAGPLAGEALAGPLAEGSEEATAQTSRPMVLSSAAANVRLPRLAKYAGENLDDDDDSLDRFLREFERHAQLASWSGDVKRLQFEVHLTGRALKVYESLPAEERRDYETARDSLRKRMQPVRLDSYRRSQFNSRKQQPGEGVSKFAQDLQRLMDKAYIHHHLDPDLRDKILLGQFEQGLANKWKRHLRYPLEAFEDALQQARLAEAVEEQLLTDPSQDRRFDKDHLVYQPRKWTGKSSSTRSGKSTPRRGDRNYQTEVRLLPMWESRALCLPMPPSNDAERGPRARLFP